MPTAVPASTPKTIIGPATINIFAAMPYIMPSVLNSIAGDATELAKPVIGTIDPAPAFLPILSYTPNPVKRVPKKIRITLTVPASTSPCNPNANSKIYRKNCPMQQINPPTRYARKQFLKCCVGGSNECTYAM